MDTINLDDLKRHFRHYELAVNFISQERYWFKEVLGSAYAEYDDYLGELLGLLETRMRQLCHSLSK